MKESISNMNRVEIFARGWYDALGRLPDCLIFCSRLARGASRLA